MRPTRGTSTRRRGYGASVEVERLTPGATHIVGPERPVVMVGVAERAFDKPPPFDVLLTDDTDPPPPWVACREGVGAGLTVESLAYSTLQSGAVFREWLASRSTPRASDDADPPVLLDRTGDVLEITLNRPAVRNAYNAAMRDALVEALELAQTDE